MIHLLPVNQRPEGYNPLETKNLDPEWIRRLGQSGKDCYDAIVARDLAALGESMNECMQCWEAILPGTVRHRTIQIDLPGLLRYYQAAIRGPCTPAAAAATCTSSPEEPVPGAFHVKVRI